MRILIVEDDPNVAGFIRKGLQEERYAVDVARDGEEGLLLARDAPYDLIILDIMLPKQDRFSVCRHLRTARISTPILLLTARESIEDKVSGLDTGADDYLTKPFAFPKLLARVRALLRLGRAEQSALLCETRAVCRRPSTPSARAAGAGALAPRSGRRADRVGS